VCGVSECDLETSKMRRLRPDFGLLPHKKGKFPVTQRNLRKESL
jgi:hypothetical protein